MMLNNAVLAPIPSANTEITIRENPRFFLRLRTVPVYLLEPKN
jgi:hypothetical protein